MTFASARHTENMALLSLVDGGSRGRLACVLRALVSVAREARQRVERQSDGFLSYVLDFVVWVSINICFSPQLIPLLSAIKFHDNIDPHSI